MVENKLKVEANVVNAVSLLASMPIVEKKTMDRDEFSPTKGRMMGSDKEVQRIKFLYFLGVYFSIDNISTPRRFLTQKSILSWSKGVRRSLII